MYDILLKSANDAWMAVSILLIIFGSLCLWFCISFGPPFLVESREMKGWKRYPILKFFSWVWAIFSSLFLFMFARNLTNGTY